MISIIIPVFNSGKYLNQCIDSILNQTFKEFEIILVDDGSSDDSLNIIESYAKNNKNIKYFTQSNNGAAAARNFALTQCSGDFIAFIDSDDYIESSYLEDLMFKMLNQQLDIVICGYSSVFDDDLSGKNIEQCFKMNDYNKFFTGEYVAELMLNYEIDGFLWNKIFKKDKLIESNFIFEEGRHIEDFYPVFRQVAEAERIGFINKPLYNYRQRANSSMHKITMKRLDDYCKAILSIVDYAEKKHFDKSKIMYFQVISFITLINDYYDNYKNVNRKFYDSFKNYNLEVFKPKYLNVLKCYKISIKNKILLLAWNLKIYRLLKTYIKKTKY